MNIKDLLIAVLSLFDVISGAVLALNFGFLMVPSAIGYATGAVGGMLTGAATPISFMYESLVLSYGQYREFRGRITMILIAAFFTVLLGVLGLPQLIVNSIGQEIFLGMLAGVGLYLAKVGLEIAFQDKLIGIPCLIAAIFTQFISNDLVTTVSISVPLGILLNFLFRRNAIRQSKNKLLTPKYKSWIGMIKSEMKPVKLVFNRQVLIGSLALSTLTIGGNIAYTAANSQMSHTPATYNQSTIISGVADFTSSVFGGANMELIISPTAAAPHPVFAAILLMLIASLVLTSGLVYKLAKWIPLAAMGGYLFAIGGLIILPYNALDAFRSGNVTVVGLTTAITLFTNPFYGIAAGTLAKLLVH